MAERPRVTSREVDVVDLLLEQHAQIEDLFRHVLASTGPARRDSFNALVRLLVVHEAVEEAVIHPAARSHVEQGEALVDARLAEEEQARQMLQELAGTDVDSVDFDDLLVRLRTAVLTHARREERWEFGHLRQSLSPAQLQNLARAVVAATAAAPTRPHGDAPTVEQPQVLADQVRDALHLG